MTTTMRVKGTPLSLLEGQRVLSCNPIPCPPLGAKGVGELAMTRMAAAIASAVFHATGTRFRSLPISIERVPGHRSTSAPEHR